MSKEKYLSLCEQMDIEPKEDKCPPDIDDFPLPIQQAVMVFNRLGDRVFPDVGYLGKDYTSLPIHMRVVDVRDEELFLEALVHLDAHLIKKSGEQLRKARKAAEQK